MKFTTFFAFVLLVPQDTKKKAKQESFAFNVAQGPFSFIHPIFHYEFFRETRDGSEVNFSL